MKTTRSTKAPSKTTNTVILGDGPGRRVTYTTERGSLMAMRANSLGELLSIGAEEAQEQIACLLSAGWRVERAA